MSEYILLDEENEKSWSHATNISRGELLSEPLWKYNPVKLSDPGESMSFIVYETFESSPPEASDWKSTPHDFVMFKEIHHVKRLQDGTRIVIPFNIDELFIDLTKNSGFEVLNIYNSIHDSIVSLGTTKNTSDILQKLDDLQFLFGAVKRRYDANTLEYAIYNKIQEKIIQLEFKLKHEDSPTVIPESDEIRQDLQALTDMRKAAIESGLEDAAIFEIGQTLGGMKIYKLK